MKKPILFIASLFLGASLCAFRIDAGTNNNSAETLASLYGAVPCGGYIYVVTPGLTDPKVVIELVRAKKRGVDVRVIADRQKLREHRDRVVLYNLQHYGIPVKINSRPGRVELNVSTVNDSCVVTGTYDYSSRQTSDRAPTITMQRDTGSVQECKRLFDAMWHDGHAYKTL